MARALRFISLTCAALVLGLTLAHVLEAPGKRQLSGAEWTVVQNTFYAGFAVVGGIGEVLGLVSTCALAVLVRHRRGHRLLMAVAALAFLGTLLSFAFGNRPINDQVAAWMPGTLPPDWATYRDRWDAAHSLSALLAALAFVTLLVSTLTVSLVESRSRAAADAKLRLADATRGEDGDADGHRGQAAHREPVAR
jgi:hypothetical protein